MIQEREALRIVKFDDKKHSMDEWPEPSKVGSRYSKNVLIVFEDMDAVTGCFGYDTLEWEEGFQTITQSNGLDPQKGFEYFSWYYIPKRFKF